MAIQYSCLSLPQLLFVLHELYTEQYMHTHYSVQYISITCMVLLVIQVIQVITNHRQSLTTDHSHTNRVTSRLSNYTHNIHMESSYHTNQTLFCSVCVHSNLYALVLGILHACSVSVISLISFETSCMICFDYVHV